MLQKATNWGYQFGLLAWTVARKSGFRFAPDAETLRTGTQEAIYREWPQAEITNYIQEPTADPREPQSGFRRGASGGHTGPGGAA